MAQSGLLVPNTTAQVPLLSLARAGSIQTPVIVPFDPLFTQLLYDHLSLQFPAALPTPVIAHMWPPLVVSGRDWTPASPKNTVGPVLSTVPTTGDEKMRPGTVFGGTTGIVNVHTTAPVAALSASSVPWLLPKYTVLLYTAGEEKTFGATAFRQTSAPVEALNADATPVLVTS
jgi:hypothetical protein